MQTRYSPTVAVGIALLAAAMMATSADAQSRRAARRGAAPVPVQPVPQSNPLPTPAPVVPAPESTPPAPPAANPAPATGEHFEARGMEHRGEGHLIHGRELIGMTIWGGDRQRLGTIKDFVVDYEADCPHIYFALAPEISGWSGEYVVVPFDAFHIGFDERQRTDYFVLGVAIDNLRRAPRLGVDRWTTFHDRHFFNDATQFYQRVERTTSRQDLDVSREGRENRSGRQESPPTERRPDTSTSPRTEPRHEMGEGQENAPRPETKSSDRQRDTSTAPRTDRDRDTGRRDESGRHDDTYRRNDSDRREEAPQRDESRRPSSDIPKAGSAPAPNESSPGAGPEGGRESDAARRPNPAPPSPKSSGNE